MKRIRYLALSGLSGLLFGLLALLLVATASPAYAGNNNQAISVPTATPGAGSGGSTGPAVTGGAVKSGSGAATTAATGTGGGTTGNATTATTNNGGVSSGAAGGAGAEVPAAGFGGSPSDATNLLPLVLVVLMAVALGAGAGLFVLKGQGRRS